MLLPKNKLGPLLGVKSHQAIHCVRNEGYPLHRVCVCSILYALHRVCVCVCVCVCACVCSILYACVCARPQSP